MKSRSKKSKKFIKNLQNQNLTPRAKDVSPGFRKVDIFKARIQDREKLKISDVPDTIHDLKMKFDWSKTALFARCQAQVRFSKL